MLASELNKYIEIWADTDGIDESGAPIKTFSKLKGTYASVKVLRGGKSYDEYKENATWLVEFGMRWDSRIDTSVKLKYNDEFYQIENIEVLGRNAGLLITGKVFKKDE